MLLHPLVQVWDPDALPAQQAAPAPLDSQSSGSFLLDASPGTHSTHASSSSSSSSSDDSNSRPSTAAPTPATPSTPGAPNPVASTPAPDESPSLPTDRGIGHSGSRARGNRRPASPSSVRRSKLHSIAAARRLELRALGIEDPLLASAETEDSASTSSYASSSMCSGARQSAAAVHGF